MGRGKGKDRGKKIKHRQSKDQGLSELPSKLVLKNKVIAIPKPEHGFKIRNQDNLFLINGGNKKNGWRSGQEFFRSLIVDNQGQIVSSGFPKFFNYNETSPLAKEHAAELVDSFKTDSASLYAEMKADGTLVIRSVYKGNVIWRTRGTFDGGRFKKLIEKFVSKNHPELNDPKILSDSSLLFEFLTTENDYSNVLATDKEQMFLLGEISHADLSLATRKEKEELAKNHNLEVIPEHSLSGINGLQQLSKDVACWEKEEGIVVRFSNEQKLIKVKSKSYLELHRLKHGMDEKAIADKIKADKISNQKEWETSLEKSGADHELIEATKELAAKQIEAAKKASATFEELLDEVDIIAIQKSGNRQKVIKEIHARYEDEQIRQAALLIFDGQEGAAETKLEKAFS